MGSLLDPFRGLDTVSREAVEEAAPLAEGTWVDLYLYQEETLAFARAAATDGDEGAWREAVPHQIASMVEGCFHSGVAGSLRQPLTSIKGYAESLLPSEVSWPEDLRRDFLETIGQQTDRLDQVVSDLLIPARWESGAVILDPVVFTTKSLLDQGEVELEKQLRARPVHFRWDPTLAPVLVDPQRMVHVILWSLQVADERQRSDNTLRV